MGLIETASANSVWRGMDYYENRKVVSWAQTGTFAYDGIVSGSEGNKYTVHIETNHPRRSTCNSPARKETSILFISKRIIRDDLPAIVHSQKDEGLFVSI